MAIKRNYIKLKKEIKGDEVLYETFVTPGFIPFRKVYQSIEAESEFKKAQNGEGEITELEAIDSMINTVVDIYEGQFTRDDLIDRLHAPDFMEEIQAQISFVAQGQMEDDRKKELARILK